MKNKIDDENKYEYKCSKCLTFSINWDRDYINWNDLCDYYVCENCYGECWDEDKEFINDVIIEID